MIDLQHIHAAKQEAGIVRTASPFRHFTAWRCFNNEFCHCRSPSRGFAPYLFSPLTAKPIDPDQNRIAERGAAIDLYQRATSWLTYPDVAKPQAPRFF
jgi:hypothetical protein